MKRDNGVLGFQSPSVFRNLSGRQRKFYRGRYFRPFVHRLHFSEYYVYLTSECSAMELKEQTTMAQEMVSRPMKHEDITHDTVVRMLEGEFDTAPDKKRQILLAALGDEELKSTLKATAKKLAVEFLLKNRKEQ